MKLRLPHFDKSRPTVLCLSSLQFNRDIAMLQQHAPKYNWAAWLDKYSVAAQTWVPDRLRVQAAYVDDTGPDAAAVWQKSKEFALDNLRAVKAEMNLVAVMAGNWDYWNDEGMRLACEAAGVPFLVLMREHNVTEARKEMEWAFFGQFSRIPKVTAVAVAGQTSVELFDELKIHSRSILRATGLPRFDVWHQPTQPEYDRPIVLFSYLKGYQAENHFVEMMLLFERAAQRHPSVPFIIKAKNTHDMMLIKELKQRLGLTIPVVDSFYLPSLVANARAIVGYFSLAVYEGLLTPARIMAPCWGETAAADPRYIAPSPTDKRLEGHIDFITSDVAFSNALDRAASEDSFPVDHKARAALFAEYFTYSPHEMACTRVERFVEEFT